MIRINLLNVESDKAVVPATPAAPSARRVATVAMLLLGLTVVGIAAWFWTLHRQSTRVDLDIARAQLEAQQLQTVLAQVRTFEARTLQLRERVTLIERLRTGQSAPARVLDQISRSVPDNLWLADMTQAGSDFTIAGFANSMTALSDFAAALEATRWFRRPVEIIDSEVTADATAGELVRFVVKASYVDPDAPPAPAAAPEKLRP